MNKLQLTTDPKVDPVFDNYPEHVREKILNLRRLILEAARETDGVTEVEETLKWGEPSYLSPKGSTIRMDWKAKNPEQYAMYFKCTSKLVPSFRAVYGDIFQFEGNRAIVFKLDDPVPETELKRCIAAGLTYHRVKHLPELGLSEEMPC